MFQNILFSIVAFTVAMASHGQQKRAVVVPEDDIFIHPIEPQSEFPGGHEAMLKFLSKNLVYPEAAAKAKVQGIVFVGVIITETGQITEPKILKGIGYGCDEEAIRVIKLMPPWKPSQQNGKPIDVQYQLPIRFTLPVAAEKAHPK